DAVLGELVLGLIKIVAQKFALAVNAVTQTRLQSPLIGNLEVVIREADDQREAILRIDDVLKIAKSLPLRRVVVQRVGAAIGGLDAQIVFLVAAQHVVAEVAGAAPVLSRWRERIVAAAIERNLPARLQQSTVGCDVDDAG